MKRKGRLRNFLSLPIFIFYFFQKDNFSEDNVDQFKRNPHLVRNLSHSDMTYIISQNTQPLNYSSIIIFIIWEVALWFQYQKPLNVIHSTALFTSRKLQKTRGFLTFSKGNKKTPVAWNRPLLNIITVKIWSQ